MNKRNLFAELKEGMDALAAQRASKTAAGQLDSSEAISARLRHAFSIGEEHLIASSLDEIEKLMPRGPIKTKDEYDRAIIVLSGLLDAGGADEKNRLSAVVNRLGDFISDYESAHGL